eukprot:g6428.t1
METVYVLLIMMFALAMLISPVLFFTRWRKLICACMCGDDEAAGGQRAVRRVDVQPVRGAAAAAGGAPHSRYVSPPVSLWARKRKAERDAARRRRKRKRAGQIDATPWGAHHNRGQHWTAAGAVGLAAAPASLEDPAYRARVKARGVVAEFGHRQRAAFTGCSGSGETRYDVAANDKDDLEAYFRRVS